MSNPLLSIIVPCYEEHEIMLETISNLKKTTRDAEIIVVDSSVSDQTATLINQHFLDVVYHTATGSGKRNENMNEGAAIATGQILLFHHADSRLPQGAGMILEGIDWNTIVFGGFVRKHFPGSWLLDLTNRGWSKIFYPHGCYYGDNSIFVKKELFDEVGGYFEFPLFEDLDLTVKLRKRCYANGKQWKTIKDPVRTSSRRFMKRGVFKTLLFMTYIQICYYLGTPIPVLEEKYRNW